MNQTPPKLDEICLNPLQNWLKMMSPSHILGTPPQDVYGTFPKLGISKILLQFTCVRKEKEKFYLFKFTVYFLYLGLNTPHWVRDRITQYLDWGSFHYRVLQINTHIVIRALENLNIIP